MISAIPDEKSAQSQPDDKGTHPKDVINYSKTGNTKIIAGYRCDEYLFTEKDNKSSGKVWFTKDAKLNIDKRGW